MSLNWNLTKVKNHEELCWRDAHDDQGNPAFGSDGKPLFQIEPISDALIWSTMAVEMGSITEKNYEEFHRRIMEADEVGIAVTINYFDEGSSSWKTRIPSLSEVRAHIGLSTNVGRGAGLRKFNTRIKRRKKEIKKEEERVIYPDDVTDDDMKPEKLDKMDMARRTA